MHSVSVPTKSRCAKATGLLDTLDSKVVWCDLSAGNGVRFVHLNSFFAVPCDSPPPFFYFYIAKDFEIKVMFFGTEDDAKTGVGFVYIFGTICLFLFLFHVRERSPFVRLRTVENHARYA